MERCLRAPWNKFEHKIVNTKIIHKGKAELTQTHYLRRRMFQKRRSSGRNFGHTVDIKLQNTHMTLNHK